MVEERSGESATEGNCNSCPGLNNSKMPCILGAFATTVKGVCAGMNLFRLVVVIGLFALTVSAQKPPDKTVTKPDFSGTWEYVERDSPFKDRVLVITHTGDEISMVESYVFK